MHTYKISFNVVCSNIYIIRNLEDLPLLPAARISVHEELTEMQRFLYALSPVDIVEWKNSGNLERIFSIIKVIISSFI